MNLNHFGHALGTHWARIGHESEGMFMAGRRGLVYPRIRTQLAQSWHTPNQEVDYPTGMLIAPL
jgi:hypothetical protein